MDNAGERKKTLDELDPPAWGEPEFDSHLVTTCHRLRTKPIGDFSVEELRIMIGQEIGLPWLVPLALDILERDPLAEGDYYPGDLLKSVLTLPLKVWSQQPEWQNRTNHLLKDLVDVPEELRDPIRKYRGVGG